MVADGIMGQVFSVTVAGDYNVDFTFTKAYKGTYRYRAAGRDETKDAAQRWDAIPGNTPTGITF